MPQVALSRHVEEMKKLRKVNEKLDRELGARPLRWQAQHAKVVVTAEVTSEILQAIKPHVVHPLARHHLGLQPVADALVLCTCRGHRPRLEHAAHLEHAL